MHTITHAMPLEGFKLEISFDDGERGVVDLTHLAGKGIFECWNDPAVFRSVQVGPYGELAWGDHIDLCPDALYMDATGKRPEFLGVLPC